MSLDNVERAALVEYVGKFEPTDWEWAIVMDSGIVDRFETEADALAALPQYGGIVTKEDE